MFVIYILLLQVISCNAFKFTSKTQTQFGSVRVILKSTNGEQQTDSNLWKQDVKYVDLSSIPPDSTSQVRELPLFMLSYPFFPEGSTNLHIFEMKYRTMMFDVSQKDDCIGYIMTDERTGQIAQVGTLCKIMHRELLEDGRQLIELLGIGRFRVRKILKTLPYILAEVETLEDEAPNNEDDVIELEKSVYNSIKYYIRLIQTLSDNKAACISAGAKKHRPTPTTLLDSIRRSKFSLVVGTMLQVRPKDAQLLLQSTNVRQRLSALKHLMTNVVDLTAQNLVDSDILTASTRDEIRMKTFNSDYDDDVLPADLVEATEDTDKDEWDISNVM